MTTTEAATQMPSVYECALNMLHRQIHNPLEEPECMGYMATMLGEGVENDPLYSLLTTLESVGFWTNYLKSSHTTHLFDRVGGDGGVDIESAMGAIRVYIDSEFADSIC